MATYKIEWKASALKELKRLDKKIIPRIISVVESLANNPFPSGVRKLQGAEKRCIGLPTELKNVANNFSTLYFDSNTVTSASKIDGIHLDKDQHLILGQAIANFVIEAKIF